MDQLHYQNLKFYYSETEAKMVLFRNPARYRKGLTAVNHWEMWLYPRHETIELSKVLNADDPMVLELLDHVDKIPTMNISFFDYVNLKEAMLIWKLSKERLYQLTIRSKPSKIKIITVNGKTLFNKYELQNYCP